MINPLLLPRLKQITIPFPRFTQSEKDIIVYLSKGFTPKEIGAKIDLTTAAVRSRMYTVFRKVKAKNAAHMIAICYKKKMIV